MIVELAFFILTCLGGGSWSQVSGSGFGWSRAAGGRTRGLRVPHHDESEGEVTCESLKGVFRSIHSEQFTIFTTLFTNTSSCGETIRLDQSNSNEQMLLAQTVQTAAVTFHSAVQSAYIHIEMTTSAYSGALNQKFGFCTLQTNSKRGFYSSKSLFSLNYADPYCLVGHFVSMCSVCLA